MPNLTGIVLRVLFVVTAIGGSFIIAPVAEACEPAAAITRYEREECVDTTPFSICHAGPCKSKLGALDAMGRFHVFKGEPSAELAWLAWDTDNLTRGLDQIVTVSDPNNAACSGGKPVRTISGCVERYRIPNVKACPPFQGPNCPGNKVTATLRSLEQVNAATTPGGIVTLADGQTIKGKGRKRFWLHYEVCCPDVGSFGLPGDLLKTDIRYGLETRGGGAAIACQERSARQADPERIPDQTFPCGPQ